MAPLMCGVLVAEFQLARYRRRAEIALRTTETRKGAARALRRAVLGCMTGYVFGPAAYQQLRPVLTVTALALAALAVRGWVQVPAEDKATELAIGYFVVCTALAVVLTVVALRLLVKPELHR